VGVHGVSSENVNIIAQGQELLGQMADVKPTSQAKQSRPGDSNNIAKGKGISDDKPAAGPGPGTGRQAAKAGSTLGQTNAKPRSQGGGFLPRK
jgi:hypothetical protein